MSLKSHEARKLAVAGLAAFAAFGVAAAPASAVQTKTLTYKCKYPLIGTNPLSIKISLDIPSSVESGVTTPAFGISAVATASGNTVPGLALVEGLTSIEGVSTATSSINIPGSPAVNVKVPITIPKYVLPQPVPDPLVLNAAGSTPPLTIDAVGTAKINLDKLALNLIARDGAGDPIVLPPVTKDIDGNVVKDSDGDANSFDVYCKLDAGQDTTLGQFEVTDSGPVADTTAPTNPTVTATAAQTSVALAWSGATDNVGVTGYDVYNGATLVTSVTGTSATVSGLTANTSYNFKVVAKDAAGNKSSGGTVTAKTLSTPPVLDTTAPTNPTVTATPAITSVALAWSGATDAVGVTGYDVYNGATLVTSTASTSATVTGLTAATPYTFKVVAKDAAGNKSSGGSVSTTTKPAGTTPGGHVFYNYGLKGSATLKNLTKGSLPLTGSINADLTLATGAFTADLVLNQTQGQLTALGFLPVTAKINFVPSGKTTGSLLDGVLKTSSLVRIKVAEVKLFGAIPLAGGNSCQTKSLSKIDLKSTQAEFSPLDGGPIAGTFAISDLNGCGALNGLVSPLTSGGGNTVNAVLTPKK